jgi:hypothetical protein
LGRASTGNSYLVNPGARSEQASRPVRSAFEWVFKQAFSAKEICPKTLNDFNRPKSSNITHCSFGDEFGKTRLNLHQRSGYFNKKVSNMNWPFMDRKRSLIRKTSATKRMGSYINLSDLDPKWTGVDSQQKPEDTPRAFVHPKDQPNGQGVRTTETERKNRRAAPERVGNETRCKILSRMLL